MIALVTGGSGCGKSTWTEKTLMASLPTEKRFYIATMRVWDEESVKRVERHRRQRADMGFETIEQFKDIDAAPVPEGAVVLLEDIPNLLANEMFEEGGDVSRIVPAIERLSKKCSHLVMVTNDIFSDGIDYDPSTAEYMRLMAGINNAAAQMADLVVEVVYSVPVALKGVLPEKEEKK